MKKIYRITINRIAMSITLWHTKGAAVLSLHNALIMWCDTYMMIGEWDHSTFRDGKIDVYQIKESI